MSLRHTPLFRPLHRPRLFLGGEREPALLLAIVAGGLAVSGMNFVTLAVALTLWFGAIGLLRRIAKADPQMSRIYVRHIKYRAYYPPRSRPYRDAKTSPYRYYLALAAVGVILLAWLL